MAPSLCSISWSSVQGCSITVHLGGADCETRYWIWVVSDFADMMISHVNSIFFLLDFIMLLLPLLEDVLVMRKLLIRLLKPFWVNRLVYWARNLHLSFWTQVSSISLYCSKHCSTVMIYSIIYVLFLTITFLLFTAVLWSYSVINIFFWDGIEYICCIIICIYSLLIHTFHKDISIINVTGLYLFPEIKKVLIPTAHLDLQGNSNF